MLNLGKKIKEVRKKNKWSQTLLAEKIGADARRISNYENNISIPTLETFIKLSEVFGVTLDYFVNENVKDLASSKIDDIDLSKQFEYISKLDKKSKETVKFFLNAFIQQDKFKQMMSE